jgi:glycine oxidase
MTGKVDVAVIGGGVIGMSIAWRLTQRGRSVTVIDPAPGSGASGTAAGMLAPVTELHYGETPLLELGLASSALYPDFVAELTAATGSDVGYQRLGTVAAAWDAADLHALGDLFDFQRRLGLDVEQLSQGDLKNLEPALAPGLPGGLLVRGDHHVNPRLLQEALTAAAMAGGAVLVPETAAGVRTEADTAVGVDLLDGSQIHARSVVVAAGAWSSRLQLPQGVLPDVRPVKGQTLELQYDGSPPVAHVIRGTARGSAIYLVPRAPGRLVVGASCEEAGFDLRPRAGAVYELLRDAQLFLPEVAEMELVDVSTSLRPGSPDNAPLLGRADIDGLVVATGHYRNGILLAPITADVIADLVCDGVVRPEAEPFTVSRFVSADRPA